MTTALQIKDKISPHPAVCIPLGVPIIHTFSLSVKRKYNYKVHSNPCSAAAISEFIISLLKLVFCGELFTHVSIVIFLTEMVALVLIGQSVRFEITPSFKDFQNEF